MSKKICPELTLQLLGGLFESVVEIDKQLKRLMKKVKCIEKLLNEKSVSKGSAFR